MPPPPPSPVFHQAFQPFPKLFTEFVTEDRRLAPAWYRLLITMWNKLGATNTTVAGAAVLVQAPGGGSPISVLDAVTGAFLGTLATTGGVPGPAVPQVLVASPWVFVAPTTGTLVVDGGQVEISRNAGATYYPVGLVGGALPCQPNDRVRVTWYGAVPPPTVFLPG